MMKKLEEDDGFVFRFGRNAVRRAFSQVISSSKKKGGLVCGVYKVAEVLRGASAENFEFCILVKSEDPANQVFCRLIEAYCWENKINIMKVDCGVTLTLMADENSEEVHHCVLVKKSVKEEEETEPVHMLLNYMKQRATWSTLKIS